MWHSTVAIERKTSLRGEIMTSLSCAAFGNDCIPDDLLSLPGPHKYRSKNVNVNR